MPMNTCGNNIRWSVVGVVTLVVTACLVLTSCASSEHRSAPASPSSPTNPSVRHTAAAPAPAPVATTTAPESPAAGADKSLAAEFATLENKLNAKMGIVIRGVGANPQQLVFGDWTSGPAWSTSKVPLTIAALREQNPPTDLMRAAITESDNAAAEKIWAGLGDPVPAAHKMEAVLSQYGDPTTVEWQRKRPPFTAFGQTIWSLTNQARFTAGAVCDSGNASIFNLMGQVESGQSWGLGVIADTRFKGGWGPSPSGSYLVRQLGVLKTPTGLTAVAVATEPASGAFNDGTQELTEVANWLTAHIAELPTGQCDH